MAGFPLFALGVYGVEHVPRSSQLEKERRRLEQFEQELRDAYPKTVVIPYGRADHARIEVEREIERTEREIEKDRKR
jgi:hypothetical protein